jgi:DNA repair exonuclease SbcCD ATPase subunit
MKTLPLILGYQITIRLPEIVIFTLGAIVLGFTLHYFWNVRKTIRIQKPIPDEINDNDNWKLKYYNDMDVQEKVLQQLRDRLAVAEENEQLLEMSAVDMRKELTELNEKYLVAESNAKPPTSTDDYLVQLKSAQDHLFQHNQHIDLLLQQIQVLKESEKKFQDLQAQYAAMNQQMMLLRRQVSEKDAEIARIQQEKRLTQEVNDRMDKAFTDFNVMQEKLQKLEGYLEQPHSKKIEYDQLQETYFMLSKEYDEVKGKQMSLYEENQRMSRILADTEDKLKEANFQRQQLQKKTLFLEELNRDLQEATEQHKKMESQLRRISEMESFLSARSPQKDKDIPE